MNLQKHSFNKQQNCHIKFFSSEERAFHRIDIHQRRLYKNGTLFDTDCYETHDKIGYAAFTLNTNGELSAFRHTPMDRPLLVHSSMNAGEVIASAGEFLVQNGELRIINTYSGHYKPSLFNIYRGLQHFKNNGIDIRQTKIHTHLNPRDFGLLIPTQSVNVPRDNQLAVTFYEINAIDLFKTVKEQLNIALQQIQQDISQYQAISFKNIVFAFKDWTLGSQLTQKRMQIAQDLTATVKTILANGTKSDNLKLESVLTKLQTIKKANDELSQSYGKSTDTGRLNTKIKFFIQSIHTIQDFKPKALEEDMAKMKKFY